MKERGEGVKNRLSEGRGMVEDVGETESGNGEQEEEKMGRAQRKERKGAGEMRNGVHGFTEHIKRREEEKGDVGCGVKA